MVVAYISSIIFGVFLIIVAIMQFVMVASQPVDASDGAGGALTFAWARFALLPAGLFAIAWGGNGFRRLKHAKATEKTKTADEELRIYESPDSLSPLLVKIPEGTDIELGAVTETNGVDWILVKLADGKQGYALGNARVHTVLKGVLQKETPAYEFADMASPALYMLPVGTELEIAKGDWDSAFDQVVMVRAWQPDGRKIHIRSGSKVDWL